MQWIYKYRDVESRYILGVHGRRPLLGFGINPSTAVPDNLDNTLRSVQRIAAANGYDGWIMFNVYPQRSTDPNGLHGEIDAPLHRENIEWLRWALDTYYSPDVWVAWGNLIEKRAYLAPCLSDITELISQYGCRCLCAGKVSVLGHPHHPLYLKKDEPLRTFDLEDYMQAFSQRLAASGKKRMHAAHKTK